MEDFQVGQMKDIKFGLITYEVERVSENSFVVNDLSDGWTCADINFDQAKCFIEGTLDPRTLNWY